MQRKSTGGMMSPAPDVDTYLARLPADVRQALGNLRRIIKATAPKAEELISYQMPGYKYHGALVYFAAFKNHCSLFPASTAVVKTFAEELKNFEVSGSTIHFSPENPLPASLVKKIVKIRMAQNEERAARKSKSKAKRTKPRRRSTR